MNRKETTKFLSKLVENLINPNEDNRIYWAREVTFDYTTFHRVRVDYMKFKSVNNSVSGIEKGDFFFVMKLNHLSKIFTHPMGIIFWEITTTMLCQKKVYDMVKPEIPYGIGVYCPAETGLYSVRNARRKNRERPVSEMLLMMFRSLLRDTQKEKK